MTASSHDTAYTASKRRPFPDVQPSIYKVQLLTDRSQISDTHRLARFDDKRGLLLAPRGRREPMPERLQECIGSTASALPRVQKGNDVG